MFCKIFQFKIFQKTNISESILLQPVLRHTFRSSHTADLLDVKLEVQASYWQIVIEVKSPGRESIYSSKISVTQFASAQVHHSLILQVWLTLEDTSLLPRYWYTPSSPMGKSLLISKVLGSSWKYTHAIFTMYCMFKLFWRCSGV